MRRAVRICLSLLALGALAACGDDDDKGVDLGGQDAEMPHDAGPDAARDATTTVMTPPDITDAGHDAGEKDIEKPAVDIDEDAGKPHCNARLCKSMGDECRVASCDDASGECKVKAKPNDTPCGDSTLDFCTQPDSCQAGVCKANDKAKGTACDDHNVDCHKDDSCDGHGKCVDSGLKAKGSACGDRTTQNECDDLDSCDSHGVCQPNFAAPDAPCGDQNQLCRLNDSCDGQGTCVDGGAWAPGQCPSGESGGSCLCGSSVTTTCHPHADVCAGPVCVLGNEDNIPCGDEELSDPECDAPDRCKSGTCSPNNLPPTTACGDQVAHGACDLPNRCNGSGACGSNPASSTTPCGNSSNDCEADPLCDGLGTCQDPEPAPLGTACGSNTETQCNHADTCNGSGVCQTNLGAVDSACGDHSSTECTEPDTCSAGGVCLPHNQPEGTECGDQGQLCKLDDHCDDAGLCADQGETATCGISGSVQAGGAPLAGVVVETLGAGAVSTTTDEDGNYQLTVPLGQTLVFHVHDVTGYWGYVQPLKLTAADASNSLDFALYSDANLATVAAQVNGVSITPGTGLLIAQLSGDDLSGNEKVTSSASSSMPIVQNEDGDFVLSNTIMNTQNGLMLFYNMTVPNTTLTPSAGCTLAPAVAQRLYPVFAHTVTYVEATCD